MNWVCATADLKWKHLFTAVGLKSLSSCDGFFAPATSAAPYRRGGVTEPLEPRQPMLQAEWSSGRGPTNVLPIRSTTKATAFEPGSPEASTRSRAVNLVPQLVALHPMGIRHWQALHSVSHGSCWVVDVKVLGL